MAKNSKSTKNKKKTAYSSIKENKLPALATALVSAYIKDNDFDDDNNNYEHLAKLLKNHWGTETGSKPSIEQALDYIEDKLYEKAFKRGDTYFNDTTYSSNLDFDMSDLSDLAEEIKSECTHKVLIEHSSNTETEPESKTTIKNVILMAAPLVVSVNNPDLWQKLNNTLTLSLNESTCASINELVVTTNCVHSTSTVITHANLFDDVDMFTTSFQLLNSYTSELSKIPANKLASKAVNFPLTPREPKNEPASSLGLVKYLVLSSIAETYCTTEEYAEDTKVINEITKLETTPEFLVAVEKVITEHIASKVGCDKGDILIKFGELGSYFDAIDDGHELSKFVGTSTLITYSFEKFKQDIFEAENISIVDLGLKAFKEDMHISISNFFRTLKWEYTPTGFVTEVDIGDFFNNFDNPSDFITMVWSCLKSIKQSFRTSTVFGLSLNQDEDVHEAEVLCSFTVAVQHTDELDGSIEYEIDQMVINNIIQGCEAYGEGEYDEDFDEDSDCNDIDLIAEVVDNRFDDNGGKGVRGVGTGGSKLLH